MAAGYGIVFLPTFLLFRHQGWYQGWMYMPAIAVTLIYPLSGMAVGGWFGLLGVTRDAALRRLAAFRAFLEAAEDPRDQAVRSMTPDEMRRGHRLVVEQILTLGTGPADQTTLSTRLLTRWLRDGLREDFLPTMIAGGASVLGYADVRNWLLERGLTNAARGLHAEIRRWRGFLIAGAAAFAALPILLLRIR